MKRAFVISDIHGMYYHFEHILSFWERSDYLVILGDAIDRGENSLKVIQKISALKKAYGDKVIYLKGNHEELFLDFLDKPNESGSLYVINGGNSTIRSFFKKNSNEPISAFELEAKKIKKHFTNEINLIRNSKLFYEWGNVLFTHAGFQSIANCWRDSKDSDFTWIRNHYKMKNKTGLVNVFGHTPTCFIHENNNENGIWVSEDKTYIGIDGGCSAGGQLNAILIEETGELIEKYCVCLFNELKKVHELNLAKV